MNKGMHVKNWFLGFLMLATANIAFAETPGDRLWEKLAAIRTMDASFTQKVFAKKREISASSGTMAFERPGHFRWETKKPMEQLLVADGKKFWLYDIDLEQVTVKPQAEIMGAAAGLFLGDNRAQLTKDFEVTQVEEKQRSVFDLRALSKEANIQRMVLRFDEAILHSMDLYDQLGQRTVIAFQKVQQNETLSPKLFRFSPPKGVDVVEQ